MIDERKGSTGHIGRTSCCFSQCRHCRYYFALTYDDIYQTARHIDDLDGGLPIGVDLDLVRVYGHLLRYIFFDRGWYLDAVA